MIEEQQRAYLQWENINFFTPAPKGYEEREINDVTGSVVHGVLEQR